MPAYKVVLLSTLLLAANLATPTVSQALFTGHHMTTETSLVSKISSWISSAFVNTVHAHTPSAKHADDATLSFQIQSAVHHSTLESNLGQSAKYSLSEAHDDAFVSKQHKQYKQRHTYGGIRTKRQRVRRLKDPRAYLAQREAILAKARQDDDALGLNASSCDDNASFNLLAASLDSLHASPSSWEDVELVVPDVTSRLTLLALARMSSAAYEAPPHPPSWEPTDGFEGWNVSDSFGWVENGIRGHVFSNKANKGQEDQAEEIVVVALKGTSAAILPGGDDTAKRDKLNDNLLFSCCCARVSWTWSPSVYYPLISDLYNNVSYAYPNAQIWVTGHSLGGALGSLIGYTFGVPSVTFEAPAERMAAKRLHLPLPPGSVKRGDGKDGLQVASVTQDDWDPPILPVTHVFHSADPIPMGTCTGPSSLCGSAGYAMESTCHAGQVVLYDTAELLGWAQNIAKHRIATLTEDLLLEDWGERVRKAKGIDRKQKRKVGEDQEYRARWWPWKKGDGSKEGRGGEWEKLGETPDVANQNECVDCGEWQFVDEDKWS